jgi:nuclear transport factor 2 (NTF2) superfamily protein
MSTHPPVPPFIRETAIEKVRLAEDNWNSRNPEKVALAYTADSCWRNRPNSQWTVGDCFLSDAQLEQGA